MRYLLPLLLACATLAHAAPPDAADFLRKSALAGPVLSPDGKHVAAIMTMAGNKTTLVVIPTNDPSQANGIKAFGEADIGSVYWLSDTRLAFTLQPQEEAYSRRVLPGLWTLDREGKNLRQWVTSSGFSGNLRTPKASRLLSAWWSLSDIPFDGSDTVILANRDWRMRLNIVTGERRPLTENIPGKIFNWVLDARLEPLFAFQALDDARWQVLLRDAQGELTPWSVAEQAFSAPPRVPRWVDKAGDLYLSRPSGPEGRAALHRATSLDPQAPTDQVLASPVYDIEAEPVLDRDSGVTVGIRYETDIPRTLWLHPELEAAQAAVDRLLPQAANQLQCTRCLSVPHLLVTSVSDSRPARHFIYDRATRHMTLLAASRPWMPEGSHQQVTTLQARDGQPIAVQLTRPRDVQGPAPTVLLVHGGPWARGNHWGWQAQSQFYASRGYLVLEADFRGSLGYGERHFHAGLRQWGRAMQDDLDDVLAWAVKEGLSDPARLCMVGEGYGGYAALMGLVRSEKSGKLACAVAQFAPTDLTRLESRHWSSPSSATPSLALAQMPAPARTDADMLATQSPLTQAERMHAPLLLAYADSDGQVPLIHGTALRDKLAALGRPPQWVAYEGPGRSLSRADQREDLMRRIEAFLATHLAPKP